MDCLYHGSNVSGITELKANSKLHGTEKMIAYATDNIPYALLFIWDENITGYSGKHVTGWIKNGITYYEEQFPDQLKTFYDGASGYLYHLNKSTGVQVVQNREGMFYSMSDIPVINSEYISDVYAELMKYDATGLFKVLRYREQSDKRKNELIDLISDDIVEANFYTDDNAHGIFIKKHFQEAWKRAESHFVEVRLKK